MTRIASKLPEVGTTIFTQISALAQAHEALNLGQGFPDFDGPDYLRERMSYYVDAGYNQYPPMAGIGPLREQIALKVERCYQRRLDTDREITVVPGATEALFCAIMCSINRGDEVIIFDPAYDSYEPAIRLAGGIARRIPLASPDFSIDWSRVHDAVNANTRMLVLNSPHNPTGAVLSAEDISQLKSLVSQYDILLLADEVYEHLIYDGETHHSLLLHDQLYQRAFVVSSFGKTYHVTGWKTGYCVAPPALTAEFRKVHQFVTFVGVTPIQWALADFMAEYPDYASKLAGFYQAKRDRFCQAMTQSRFRFRPCRGSYFQLMDYAAISDRGDMAMAQWLTMDIKVAAIPISVFYEQPPKQRYLRFCFAKDDDTLLEAAARLANL